MAQSRRSLISQLRKLDRQAAKIRQQLDIHPPEQEIYCTVSGGNTITVKANGYGGAALIIYDDDSPYYQSQCVLEEQDFPTEQEACNAASKKDEEYDHG